MEVMEGSDSMMLDADISSTLISCRTCRMRASCGAGRAGSDSVLLASRTRRRPSSPYMVRRGRVGWRGVLLLLDHETEGTEVSPTREMTSMAVDIESERANRIVAAIMSTVKGSFLFVALPPEGQDKSLVYQNLKSKVTNSGSPLGEISTFPIPQFKVSVDKGPSSNHGRLGHWTHWLY